MDVKQILTFIKIEHTLFSLPFVLIGYILAHNEFVSTGSAGLFSWVAIDLAWILLAAIGARGLACLLYTSPSPRDATLSRMPSSA